ncbi:MAG: DUF1257 domain-containing protein [Candidatus Obscuribacterales bacterium]|jgi:hypothetical protein|nr:DUF1257 domain-containing protein [Candidatus Obscuribacterales bacterium]
MSHITKVKTKLVDLEMLHLALKDIDCQFEEGDDLKIPEVNGPVLMKLTFAGMKRHVALVADSDGSFSIVGDATLIGNLKRDQQIGRLMQRYAYHSVKSTLLKQGFQLDQESVGEQSEIRLTLRRTN